MAAGLGTRLRPLTYELPKPMVPVVNRPVMEHILRLLPSHGFEQAIANLHWFPELIRDRFQDGSELGIELTYSHEDELLGTAGGVRNVAEYFGSEPFLVMAGDALTDIDLTALRAAHEANGGIATLAVKRVPDVGEFGVVIVDSGGRIQGFQEKPDPAEALSDLCNCMIYAFSPEVFDYFPRDEMPDPVDFAHDVFPALLAGDVPFYVHEIETYWNDVGTLPEYLQGNLDAVDGAIALPRLGGALGDGAVPDGLDLPAEVEVDGRVLFGEGCEVGAGAALTGPLVIGAGASIGAGARVKEALLLPGASVPDGGVLARGIAGDAARLASGEW